MSYVICEQQRRRSACASAQSNTSRFYGRNFMTLASFCGCAGRFVSGLVRNSRRHVLSCRGSYNKRTQVYTHACITVWIQRTIWCDSTVSKRTDCWPKWETECMVWSVFGVRFGKKKNIEIHQSARLKCTQPYTE